MKIDVGFIILINGEVNINLKPKVFIFSYKF